MYAAQLIGLITIIQFVTRQVPVLQILYVAERNTKYSIEKRAILLADTKRSVFSERNKCHRAFQLVAYA